MHYLTLKELCECLSISQATGKNWIKLGKIKAQSTNNGKPYFEEGYVNRLKEALGSGELPYLKSRRNKRYSMGNGLYKSYISADSKNLTAAAKLIDEISDRGLVITDEAIRIILAGCAMQLVLDKNNCIMGNDFSDSFFKAYSGLGNYFQLVTDLIDMDSLPELFADAYGFIFTYGFSYVEGEDLLGLLYMSLKNMADKKEKGAYYTPDYVVRELLDQLFSDDVHDETKWEKRRLLDPCCGTGNFLIKLPCEASLYNIYGNDIDEISIALARINLALKYGAYDIEILYKNITCGDFLHDYCEDAFDYIFGNPPWGAYFSEAERKRLADSYSVAAGKTIESYDVFIEEGLRRIKKHGALSFVLPEAVLNVKSHEGVRRLICKNTSITYLSRLGNIFYKVNCPCIILQLTYTGSSLDTRGMRVRDYCIKTAEKKDAEVSAGKEDSAVYEINTSRNIDSRNFNFFVTDKEYAMIQRLMADGGERFKYLKDNADFALGIVTGDNERYIQRVQTLSNEPIIRGRDISKYKIHDGGNYIEQNGNIFQQMAPIRMYRAEEKLIYRFINKKLIFAYDDEQRLILNSCNLLIPKIEGMSVKYILAILNSGVSQFLFDKCFHSVKVLRSHIEQLPIPVADAETRKKVEEYADALIRETDEEKWNILYEELDRYIASLFGL